MPSVVRPPPRTSGPFFRHPLLRLLSLVSAPQTCPKVICGFRYHVPPFRQVRADADQQLCPRPVLRKKGRGQIIRQLPREGRPPPLSGDDRRGLVVRARQEHHLHDELAPGGGQGGDSLQVPSLAIFGFGDRTCGGSERATRPVERPSKTTFVGAGAGASAACAAQWRGDGGDASPRKRVPEACRLASRLVGGPTWPRSLRESSHSLRQKTNSDLAPRVAQGESPRLSSAPPGVVRRMPFGAIMRRLDQIRGSSRGSEPCALSLRRSYETTHTADLSAELWARDPQERSANKYSVRGCG